MTEISPSTCSEWTLKRPSMCYSVVFVPDKIAQRRKSNLGVRSRVPFAGFRKVVHYLVDGFIFAGPEAVDQRNDRDDFLSREIMIMMFGDT